MMMTKLKIYGQVVFTCLILTGGRMPLLDSSTTVRETRSRRQARPPLRNADWSVLARSRIARPSGDKSFPGAHLRAATTLEDGV